MLLRDLAWVIDVAEIGQFTDAATVLGVTQPTLSRAVARVEAALDTRIFERTPAGVAVTPDGEVVISAARDITARHRRLTDDLAGRRDPDHGLIRLAFIDSMATSLVPQILRRFHHAEPGIKLMIRQEPTHDIVVDLETGAVELAISSWRPDGDFGWLPLQRERIVAIVPPTHRLATRKRIDLAELAGDEFIVTPVGYGFRDLVRGLLADSGVSMTVALDTADLATIEGLVAAGLGVALVPEPFAGLTDSVGLAVTNPAARRTIGMTWRTTIELAPPAQRMIDFVGRHFALP